MCLFAGFSEIGKYPSSGRAFAVSAGLRSGDGRPFMHWNVKKRWVSAELAPVYLRMPQAERELKQRLSENGGATDDRIRADHGGVQIKDAVKQYLEENGIAYQDFGTYSAESVSLCPDCRSGGLGCGRWKSGKRDFVLWYWNWYLHCRKQN